MCPKVSLCPLCHPAQLRQTQYWGCPEAQNSWGYERHGIWEKMGQLWVNSLLPWFGSPQQDCDQVSEYLPGECCGNSRDEQFITTCWPWLLLIKHFYQTGLSAAHIPGCAEQWQAHGNANTLAGPGTPGHVLLTRAQLQPLLNQPPANEAQGCVWAMHRHETPAEQSNPAQQGF